LSITFRAPAEELVVDAALDLLKSLSVVEPTASYDRHAFDNHRRLIKKQFEGSWTSLSPTMERLIYMLTSVRRPVDLIELGSFWGYTLAWFAGPCVGPYRSYEAARIIGIDVNEKMASRARSNFAKLQHCESLELIAEDARIALERISGPFDFAYIEAKSDDEDGLYLDVLKRIYDRLPPGAWVIAHDNVDWTFAEEMAEYLPYVRDKAHFSESIAFEIDECGLELSIK
jgi:predicted O-methyltransferase YrrM